MTRARRSARCITALLTAALMIAGCAQRVVVDRPPPQPAADLDGTQWLPDAAGWRAMLASFEAVRSAEFLGWLGDGMLIATRFGADLQAHHVQVPLGMRRQLTFVAEGIAAAWPQPGREARYLLFATRPATGSQSRCSLRLLDVRTQEIADVDDAADPCPVALWRPDGQRFAYLTDEPGQRRSRLHVVDAGTGARASSDVSDASDASDVSDGAIGRWQLMDWSPSGDRVLAAARAMGTAGDGLAELDLASGEPLWLIAPGLGVGIGAARYADESVVFVADLGAEFRRLYRWHRDGHIELLAGEIPWDIDELAVARHGAWIAYTVNEDGYSTLYLLAGTDRRQAALPALPHGVLFGLRFDSTGRALGFTAGTDAAPADAWALDVERRAAVRWTQGESGGMPGSLFAAPQRIAYPAAAPDRAGTSVDVPAYLYLPRGPGPYPVVVVVPQRGVQSRPGFQPVVQALVHALGAAVIAPNPPGTPGYGKSWLGSESGDVSPSSRIQLDALRGWIACQPFLDPRRIALLEAGGAPEALNPEEPPARCPPLDPGD
jgi:hypothetical protein